MRIISYNVNGIRAAVGKGFLNWLQEASPDIICLQELKAQIDQIPVKEIEALGYHSYWFPAEKKGYSGVALITKQAPDHVQFGMNMPIYDREGRFLRVDFGELSVVSVYHPSGSSGEERQNFKMNWLKDFKNYVIELQKDHPKLILCGDYNICHKPIDIHDPIRNASNSGFLPEEREWMDSFLQSGFMDSFRVFNQCPNEYSWWSYRFNARAQNKGWRIDYLMITDNLKSNLKGAAILQNVVHSDHCPAVLDIML